MSWVTHESTSMYSNPWIEVREDRITGPAGEGIYGVVTMRHPAVFVVAVDKTDRVCLVGLNRYTTGKSLEVPAGGSDGEDPLLAAQRELREETGLHARSWTPLGMMHALNGIADAPEYVFLARDLEAPGEDAEASRASQEAEGIDTISWVPFGEVLGMIADGRITDGETIAALAYAGIALGRFA